MFLLTSQKYQFPIRRVHTQRPSMHPLCARKPGLCGLGACARGSRTASASTASGRQTKHVERRCMCARCMCACVRCCHRYRAKPRQVSAHNDNTRLTQLQPMVSHGAALTILGGLIMLLLLLLLVQSSHNVPLQNAST